MFLVPVLLSPVHHSLRPGEHATRAAFRVLPAELTMLGDLSVFTDVWRKRRPYDGYFLWFLDDGTFGQEASFGEEGFWLRGAESAEVVLQAPFAPGRIRLKVTAGPAGDIVTARLGSARQRVVLPPLKSSELGVRDAARGTRLLRDGPLPAEARVAVRGGDGEGQEGAGGVRGGEGGAGFVIQEGSDERRNGAYSWCQLSLFLGGFAPQTPVTAMDDGLAVFFP